MSSTDLEQQRTENEQAQRELRDRLRSLVAEAIADTNLHDQADLDYETDRVMAVVEEEAIDRMANLFLEETNLRSMDFRNGMAMEIEPARALAANFVGCARAMLGEAPNYSETPIEMTTSLAADPDNSASWEKFAFVVQRIGPGKLTPHEARQAAEQRADKAEVKVDQLSQALAEVLRIAIDEAANPGPALARVAATVGDLVRQRPNAEELDS